MIEPLSQRKNPCVSIIIPTYNSSRTLKFTLDSVLSQDFKDFEVWVIGDGCTDDSEGLVLSYSDTRIKWFNLPANSGSASLPRNEGVKRAAGRYIAYLGHDDLWFPWHLAELVDLLETSGCDFVYSLGMNIGPDGVAGTFSLPEKSRYPKGGMSPSNWMHKKSIFDTVSPWSLKWKVSEDLRFIQDIWSSDLSVGYSKRLSVLKYPSIIWKMYAPSPTVPQQEYAERLLREPEKLCMELLFDLGRVLSRRRIWLRKSHGLFLELGRMFLTWAAFVYGRNRWPLNSFLKWRWRRKSGLRG